MDVADLLKQLREIPDTAAVWFMDPQTAKTYPLDHVKVNIMDAGGEIAEEGIEADNNWYYADVVLSSGG